MRSIILLFFASLFSFSFSQTKTDIFGSLKSRHIGPAVTSGRISCVDGVNNNTKILYVGSAGGGLWKTTNDGTTFKPVFDKYTQSIGTVTIDQNHPDTIWVGTGETWVRNSVSVGTGIYKTTNGGDSWKLMGLEESEHIAKIIIDPSNPDIVYVAVLGHLWNSNEERGVYKTTDGGKSWNKILYVDKNTGCSDLTINPSDNNTLFAGMWQFRRKGYTFNSGGPGSGLYKTTNGGANWSKIKEGMPEGELGRIAVAYSSVDPAKVYALVEAKNSALLHSYDNGENWEEVNISSRVAERPFYFSLIVPDPVDTNRIYKPGFNLYVSIDGGNLFTSPYVEGGRVHGDLHALWINPKDNSQMYLGTDGGLYTSVDRGSSWRQFMNLPVAQFYHVSVDNKKPYNVYGGLQDNGSWYAPSSDAGGIENGDWKNIGYGDGFYAFADKYDDDILYWQWQGGNIVRYYKSSGETKEIRPYSDDAKEKLRFNWNTPVVFSPTQEKVMYIGAEYLFKSTDRGDSWERISPDLTTNDPEKLKQGESGGLTIDNSTAENYCTIFTISESPVNNMIIWAGTDDGNLQITTNGGTNWQNVVENINDMPEHTWCSSVSAGNFDKNTAYVTFDGHYEGDMKTYVYKTTDLGKTWTSLSRENNKGYVHVIRQDFINRDLLFLGTEFGLFVSIDGGSSWSQFAGETPKVSVRDLVIHPTESDLVIATHGRGILIVDDIIPLRELTPAMLDSDLVMLKSKPSIIRNRRSQQTFPGDDQFRGSNPDEAADIIYYQKKRHIFGDMYIEIYDSNDKFVKKLPAGKNKGINRVSWSIRKDPPKVPRSPGLLGPALYGPTYPPGEYTVKIVKGDKTYTGKISLINDPDLPYSAEDRKMQYEIITRAYDALENLAALDKQVNALNDTVKSRIRILVVSDELKTTLTNLSERLNDLHKKLTSTSANRLAGQERLREKISDIYGAVLRYLGKPTDSQIKRLDILITDLNNKQTQLNNIVQDELPEINSSLKTKSIEPIITGN